MKKLALLVMTLACILSIPAFSNEIDIALNYKCHNGRINNADAAEVTQAARNYQINLKTFNAVYVSTCDFNKALEMAGESMSHQTFLSVYNEVFEYQCPSRDRVSAEGAIIVAKGVATNTMDLNNFKTVYYSTCDFYKAIRIAVKVPNTITDSI